MVLQHDKSFKGQKDGLDLITMRTQTYLLIASDPAARVTISVSILVSVSFSCSLSYSFIANFTPGFRLCFPRYIAVLAPIYDFDWYSYQRSDVSVRK